MKYLSLSLLFSFISIQYTNGQVTKDGGLHREEENFIFSDAPFESCHAATIEDLGSGELLAAWFGGKQEGSKDVSIWIARYKDGWLKPLKIVSGRDDKGDPMACWNPVLFKTKAGTLFLHYKVGLSPREWWAEVLVSHDNGLTWAEPAKLPQNMLGPIKNKPIQLKNGDILYPSSTESMDEKTWTVHLEKSDSTGRNWTKITVNNGGFDAIQPSILTHGNNILQLLCRSRNNRIVTSWSFDNGTKWTPLEATTLPNPNAGSDAVSLMDNRFLLVYNPLLAGKEWWEGRSVLKLAVSNDGKQWNNIDTLEEKKDGEYSYPAIIQSADGLIHIVYTYNRKCIKYIKFKL
jgi:predicted neuraminidase